MAEVAAAAMVIGTAINVQQTHKSYKAQKKEQEVQARIADVESQRKRNLALRQARVQRARIENVAEQLGAAGSSGAMGAVQSIGTQTAANLSFLDQTGRMAQQASGYAAKAAGAKSTAAVGQSVTQVAQPFADFGKLQNIFKGD